MFCLKDLRAFQQSKVNIVYQKSVKIIFCSFCNVGLRYVGTTRGSSKAWPKDESESNANMHKVEGINQIPDIFGELQIPMSRNKRRCGHPNSTQNCSLTRYSKVHWRRCGVNNMGQSDWKLQEESNQQYH